MYFENIHFLIAFCRCCKDGCTATFDTHIARKAHEKKHAGWSILAWIQLVRPVVKAQFNEIISQTRPKPLMLPSTGYRCRHPNCQVLEHTWSKLQKHMAKHAGKRLQVKAPNGSSFLLQSIWLIIHCYSCVYVHGVQEGVQEGGCSSAAQTETRDPEARAAVSQRRLPGPFLHHL